MLHSEDRSRPRGIRCRTQVVLLSRRTSSLAGTRDNDEVPQPLTGQSAPDVRSVGSLGRARRVVVGRQLAWFTGIGVVMTLAYLALYAVLRPTCGAQLANGIAWVVTAVGDTAANRRFTFGVLGRRGAARAQVEGLLVFGTGWAITSGSLVAVQVAVASPPYFLELAVLAVANLVAGLLRFTLLRWWVFSTRRQPAT